MPRSLPSETASCVGLCVRRIIADNACLVSSMTEERNLYDDYRKVFGEAPPLVNGVAIMNDTDNTGETVTAYYGDIVFKKAR